MFADRDCRNRLAEEHREQRKMSSFLSRREVAGYTENVRTDRPGTAACRSLLPGFDLSLPPPHVDFSSEDAPILLMCLVSSTHQQHFCLQVWRQLAKLIKECPALRITEAAGLIASRPGERPAQMTKQMLSARSVVMAAQFIATRAPVRLLILCSAARQFFSGTGFA